MAVTTSELSTSGLSSAASSQRDTRLNAPARTGAEAILQLMFACGVEYVFLNPGTDTAPIQEALVALAADGETVPTVVPCLYENVAIAAAHAYFLVTRRPQLVVVHVDVGTQNLGGNVHDAMRGQAGVIILAGRAPYTVDGQMPGGRDRSIQWQQDVTDQIGIVRSYVKWAHELARVETLHHLIPRAVQIAASEPAGPVYMTAAREVLMQPPDGGAVDLSVARRARPAVTPSGDPHALEQLADWLAPGRSAATRRPSSRWSSWPNWWACALSMRAVRSMYRSTIRWWLTMPARPFAKRTSYCCSTSTCPGFRVT
jgi:thiamine pyrophosphate-dependent acetolactate synthase large subunit-like protein